MQAQYDGKLPVDQILLSFGPVEARMGKQFTGDPSVDENKQLMQHFSVLQWLQQFPDWHLSACFLPATPAAPGVAIKRAAALSEGKDPDKAVQEARLKVKV